MIRIVAALLLVAAVVWAELPLGPYARPGVPVLVRADSDVEVSGWVFAIDKLGLVHPPTLPASIGDDRVEPVPEGTMLIGVIGSFPPDLAEEFEVPVRVVEVDLKGIDNWQWRALDLFDRILVALDAERDAGANHALLDWLMAGGELVTVGFAEDWAERIPRLGRYESVGDWAEAAKLDWLEHRAPRGGNVWREVYDVVRAPLGPESAALSSRWIVAGTALVLALQILLAAFGWIGPRKLMAGLIVVAAAGAVLGLVRTRADFDPQVHGAFEIVYRDGISARVRRFEITVATAPGASVAQAPGRTPCLFRAPGQPWWTNPRQPVPVPAGQQRLFLGEEWRLLEPGRIELERPEVDRNYRRLLRRVAPEGWKVVGYSRISAPKPSRGTIRLLGRVEVVPVR